PTSSSAWRRSPLPCSAGTTRHRSPPPSSNGASADGRGGPAERPTTERDLTDGAWHHPSDPAESRSGEVDVDPDRAVVGRGVAGRRDLREDRPRRPALGGRRAPQALAEHAAGG